MKHRDNDKFPVNTLFRVCGRWPHIWPYVLLAMVSLTLVSGLVPGYPLVYGDTSYVDPSYKSVPFGSMWDTQSLGTTARTGIFALKNYLLQYIAQNPNWYYMLNYLLPVVLVPVVYFNLLVRAGIRSKATAITVSMVAIANPIVMGDASKAQSFWIYLTLPIVVYLCLKMFFEGDYTLRRSVQLGFFTAISIGLLPPIIVPLVVACAIFGIFGAISFGVDRARLLSTIKGVVIAFMLFVLITLPIFLTAPSGQAAFAAKNLSGDYFNNYSTMHLVNTLRLAGNGGNGQSVLGYNESSFRNVFGYCVIAIILLALAKRSRGNQAKHQIIALMLPVLFILALAHFVSGSPSMGTTLLGSGFLSSTLRDPAKLFNVLMPFMLFGFALSLNFIIAQSKTRRVKTAISLIVAVCLCLYAWPMRTLQLGILENRPLKIRDLGPKHDIIALAKDDSEDKSRRMIIPTQHSDELNYESISESLNTFRLGGALPQTSELLNELASSLSKQDGYALSIMQSAGIKKVYVSNDQSTYAQNAFSVLSPKSTPEELNTYFSANAEATEKVGTYTSHSIPDTRPLIYSPEKIASLDSLRVRDTLPLMRAGYATIGSASLFDVADKYVKNDNTGALRPNSYAQLHDPSIITYAHSYVIPESNADKKQITFKERAPLPQLTEQSIIFTVPKLVNEIEIDDKQIVSLAQKSNDVNLTQGKHRIYALIPEKIDDRLQDLSLNTNKFVGDASSSLPGLPGISSYFVDGKKDNALAVEANNHTAYISRRIKNAVSGDRYAIQFWYKSNAEGVTFGAYEGDRLLSESHVQLSKQAEWTIARHIIRAQSNGDIDVNIHIKPTESAITAFFDDMEFYRLSSEYLGVLSSKKYLPDYLLSGREFAPRKTADKEPAIDTNFENKLVWDVTGEVKTKQSNQSNSKLELSQESYEGSNSMSLQSTGQVAYTTYTTKK